VPLRDQHIQRAVANAFTAAQIQDLEMRHFVPIRDHVKGLLGVP
jgi:hypothetical protein